MSLELLREHRRVFAEKAVLQEIYGVWFDLMIEGLPPGARVLEAGAGPGLFGPHAKAKRPDLQWVALDLIVAPWNEVAGDAHALPFPDGSFDAVVGLDFVHHLATPLVFFKEAARVLRPGGELRVIEPWVSLFSFPIYRFLHQEGATLDLDPSAPFRKGSSKEPFDGDAGVTRALAKKVGPSVWGDLGFTERARFRPLNAFAYLLSFGFKRPSLLPHSLAPLFLGIDRVIPAGLTALRVRMDARRAAGPLST